MSNQNQLPDYNQDGSMNPHVRDRFLAKKYSKEEINRIEEVSMRHAKVEQEQAYWKKQHQKDIEEWRRKREAEKAEQERLGITPVVEVLYVSPDKINVNDLNPSQRLSYEMRGLSTEELLSQGYVEPGDIPSRNYNTNNDEDEGYIPENVPPEIPF